MERPRTPLENPKAVVLDAATETKSPNSFSIEIFPTSTIGGRVTELLGGTGITINVTSSPALGIESTIDLSQHLVLNGFNVVPHIGAHQIKDEAHLAEVSDNLEKLGIREIFVIKGEGQARGKYRTATHLMQGLRHTSLSLDSIGIAGYPEGVEGMTEEQLLNSIKTREQLANDMGARLNIVTQMCFDEEKILQYASTLRSNGVGVPVTVGLPINEKMKKMYEVAVRCRVGDSKDILLMEDPESEYSPQGLMERVLDGNKISATSQVE